MRLKTVRIENFKAIKSAEFAFADFNVIVGENGSGKSSVLQAMHWMFQSARHKKVEPNGKGKGSTLSERDATYMPSPDYLNAGHGALYGNNKTQPQMDVIVTAELDRGEEEAKMWIKAARNEGVSVHAPSKNGITTAMRDPKRDFSAYIPGLAGISLKEEKRGKMIVHRSAAAGDANTVLRNILLLLKEREGEKKSYEVLPLFGERKEEKRDSEDFSRFESFISEVMGDKIELKVEFKEEEDFSIQAKFQTGRMKNSNSERFKPLELAGTGFLQVIQIFAYLTYFEPVLLLVDEPDAHLHPPAQERLMRVLAEAAKEYDTQIVATTHSPSVMRGLPPDAKIIWMKDGEVQEDDSDEVRSLMGWGLLDKKVLLMSEDSNPLMLKALLSQWPDIERQVAVWGFRGHTTLPLAETVSALIELTGGKKQDDSGELTGGSLKAMLHRDRDFMMPEMIEEESRSYKKEKHVLWVTKYSDIEAYWCDKEVIVEHFCVNEARAEEIIKESVNNRFCIEKIRKKHKEDNKKHKGKTPSYNDQQLLEEACKHGCQHKVLGKDLLSEIQRTAATREDMKSNENKFGKGVPKGMRGKMAVDLKAALEKLLSQGKPTDGGKASQGGGGKRSQGQDRGGANASEPPSRKKVPRSQLALFENFQGQRFPCV